MVLDSSDEAAQYKTGIEGWVSRGGAFFGKDERAARYHGSTHHLCECGKPVEHPWIKCPDCRSIDSDERFRALAKVEWDDETPITLFDGDEYFFDREQLEEWCEEHETTPDKVRLILCKPNYAREIGDDFYCDDLPDDEYLEDVSPGLAEKVKELNKYISDNKPILSWGPSNFAVVIK